MTLFDEVLLASISFYADPHTPFLFVTRILRLAALRTGVFDFAQS